ncbi:uncharacterized protein LOC125005943 [Mugil cephalus]|uniref:uncharacterized protein LOC125005943 n=1 Tax=Mugil cephalus TaxID=48193 RepID=UPI001FB7C4DF|nr:uncharacterized protein LOC125005943 [Mugil cephalus]
MSYGSQRHWAGDYFLPHNTKTYVIYHGTTSGNFKKNLISGIRQSLDDMSSYRACLKADLNKARLIAGVLPLPVGTVRMVQQPDNYKTCVMYHGTTSAKIKKNLISGIRQSLDDMSSYRACLKADLNKARLIASVLPLPVGAVRMVQQPDNNRTYVMYHGTTSANARKILAFGFRQSANGMLGPGVYLSRDLQKANRYPTDHPEYDKVVIRVLVNVGKVIVINRQHHPYQKTWHDHGYDTAWVPPKCGMVPSGLEEDCVWDPKRIQILDIIKPVLTYGSGAHGYM